VTGYDLPADVAGERALVGALLIDDDVVWPRVSTVVTAASFLDPRNGHVFEAVRTRKLDGGEVDDVTVADELRRVGLLDEVPCRRPHAPN
jgi:replicative DNA helicase